MEAIFISFTQPKILECFVIENSTKLQQLVLEGKISWVMTSHLEQQQSCVYRVIVKGAEGRMVDK